MTHLIRTESKYRKLLDTSDLRCIQMENFLPKSPEFDTILTSRQVSTWLIIVETPHEAWFWEPGQSREDKKYWYRVEFNQGLPSPYEERPDLGGKTEGFMIERSENLFDWARSSLICLDFDAKMRNQLKRSS
jgi:hypothetical protein